MAQNRRKAYNRLLLLNIGGVRLTNSITDGRPCGVMIVMAVRNSWGRVFQSAFFLEDV